jgi:GntR family transcriptional regulator
MAEHPGSSIVIRRESGLPIYRQLVDQLRFLIGAGRFAAGSYLPTMRELADELGLNLNTVNRAYRQLQRDGLVRSTPGKGALVAAAGGVASASATRSVEPTDAILAAAVERALSAGLAPAAIAERVAALLDEFGARIPPPPRVRVGAGRAWRSSALAAQLGAATGREVLAYDGEEDPAPALVVRPRFGAWIPEAPPLGDGVRVIDLPVVPDRAGVRRLLDVEPGGSVCVVAADVGVGAWLAEAATFAGPAAVRHVAADDAALAAAEDGEIVVGEAGLPGLDAERAIAIAPTFALTAAGEVERALAAPPA